MNRPVASCHSLADGRGFPRFARFLAAPDGDLGAGSPPPAGDGSVGAKDDGGNAWAPPASQEELNRIIGTRLERERAKFQDYEELKKKAEAFDKAAEESKSAEERAADRLAQAEAKAREAEERAAAAEAVALRAEVAADKGVPATFLTGSTREDVEKAAGALLAWKNGSAGTGGAGGLGPGARNARGNGSTERHKGGSVAAGREAFKALRGNRKDA